MHKRHIKIYILKGSRTLEVPASTEMLSFFYFIIRCEFVKCLCQISCVLYPLCNHSLSTYIERGIRMACLVLLSFCNSEVLPYTIFVTKKKGIYGTFMDKCICCVNMVFFHDFGPSSEHDI
jgi:hypothetical protein